MVNLNHEVSLTQTGDTAWVTVGKILVRVMQTDEGAVCDMYDAALIEDDMSEAHMAACYTFQCSRGRSFWRLREPLTKRRKL